MTGLPTEEVSRLFGLMSGDEKHHYAATSTLDVLWVLYDRVLKIDPSKPDDELRDRFFLSKGHGPQAFYAVLALKGFLSEKDLASFATYDSALGNHPDRNLANGVEISSGSLGHGLAMAVGAALALRIKNLDGPRVFVLVGDGELDEGSNHEAIAFAGRMGLGNLIVIAVDNSTSTWGWPGGIAPRFEIEGWDAVTVDGRDHGAIEAALNRAGAKPRVIVAKVKEY